MPRTSVVNVSQLVTVDKIELDERVGRLPNAALESVLTGLRLLFEGHWLAWLAIGKRRKSGIAAEAAQCAEQQSRLDQG